MPFAEGKEEHGHVPLRLYVRSTCWSESAHERQEAPNQKQKKNTPQYATRHATQHAASPHSNRVFFHSLSDFASNCKNGLCTNQRVLEDRRAADTSRLKLWSSNDRRKSHVFNRFPFFLIRLIPKKPSAVETGNKKRAWYLGIAPISCPSGMIQACMNMHSSGGIYFSLALYFKYIHS